MRTSEPELIEVTTTGIRLRIDGRKHFLPFAEFPWFEDATIRQIANITRPAPGHLRWPSLDVDLSLDSILAPARYPLVSQQRVSAVRERPAKRRTR